MHQRILLALFVGSLCAVAGGQTNGDVQSTGNATAVTVPVQSDTSQPQPKKKGRHVYTNDDVKAADPNDTPAASPAGNAAGAADATKADHSSGSKKSAKKADPTAIAAQQAKVDDLKSQVDGETKVVADIQRLISQDPSRAANMGPGLAKQQGDLTDLQKKFSEAQQQLDSMKNSK
jgi:hypothetical protein